MLQHNYILKYKGPEQGAEKDLQLLRSAAGITILDDSLYPKMLLVSAGNEIINQLKAKLFNWLIVPETGIPLPSTKKQLKKNIGLTAKRAARF
ncbi:MAG: hypothetical protein JNM68_03955 [Dinghuibacter sp.]|nr:hypothetical protein [Dinghuibacter sp.]